MISIIIPYKHHPERLDIFIVCIKILLHQIVNSSHDIEICIHEITELNEFPTSFLKYIMFKEPDECMRKLIDINYIKYFITDYPDHIFHRAFALNRAARMMASGDILVFMDGDLILPEGYFNGIQKEKRPMVGWDRLYLMDREATQEVLKTNTFHAPKELDTARIRTPRISGNAGGITVIDRRLFMEMKGYPEDFRGTWGGEDNAFWSKLAAFGHGFRTYPQTIYHMHHGHRTPRYEAIHGMRFRMAEWGKAKWQEHMASIGDNWGKP